jgi:hypothetical protein
MLVALTPGSQANGSSITRQPAGLRMWGIGDPRFTPVEQADDDEAQREAIDLVAVHDPRAAAELGSDVPLVLSGHRHTPEVTDAGTCTLYCDVPGHRQGGMEAILEVS